jgi:hypothetical protein
MKAKDPRECVESNFDKEQPNAALHKSKLTFMVSTFINSRFKTNL